ncbi:MAG: ABC transporter permease [Casimicrobiaceae bacterium]|nr:ABC transporter permease [Casimicrobiaceae bacterium]MCX8099220.1 ABC transporter permease [Casimicrobiaceae bacterium]MDW8313071.1 ABC transporter permease [Burkholderiales bacterium]
MIPPLLAALIEREFKNRFLGGVLAPVWWVVQPLLQLSIYAVVFGVFLKIALPEKYGGSYLAFLAVGLWPWIALTESVTRSAGSLIAQGALITKTALPRAWVPLAVVTTSFGLHFAALTVIVLVLKALGAPLALAALATTLPAWLALYLAALGAAWGVAGVNVFVRDVEPMLGPLLFLLTFLAPIQFALEVLPESIRPYLWWNPYTWVVERFHGAYLLGETAPHAVDLALVAGGALVALVGYAIFRRLAPHVDDYL